MLASGLGRRRILAAWDQAEINRVNSANLVIPCPYCGSSESRLVSRWRITDLFGLFDTDVNRLRTIYALDLPGFIGTKVTSRYRHLALRWLSGRSYVEYRRCGQCDLVFQNFPHTPASAKFFYQNLYRLPDQQEDQGTGQGIYGRDDERWVSQQRLIGEAFLRATSLPPGSRILDAGCAEGLVCQYLEEQGMEGHGLETSAAMANYAQAALHLDHIKCEDYTSASYPEGFFDGIVSHHVVEHVVEPYAFFDALAHHLKVGGYLMLQVPCLDNLKTAADHEKILQGGHIYCFSEAFLRGALEDRGFFLIDCRHTPCDLKELPTAQVTKWKTSRWADDPCSISILARRQ